MDTNSLAVQQSRQVPEHMRSLYDYQPSLANNEDLSDLVGPPVCPVCRQPLADPSCSLVSLVKEMHHNHCR